MIERDKLNACRQASLGARYYDSDWSVWLSVDPLVDKFPYVKFMKNGKFKMSNMPKF